MTSGAKNTPNPANPNNIANDVVENVDVSRHKLISKVKCKVEKSLESRVNAMEV